MAHSIGPAAVVGFAVAAVGALLLTRLLTEGNALLDLLREFAVSGLGLGAAFVTATTTAMTHLTPV